MRAFPIGDQVAARCSRAMPAFLFALIASTLGAVQRTPPITLRPADAELSEEFSSIGSVRELKDGRVLISDGRGDRVVVADLRTGNVEAVGRKGRGPGEYLSASTIRPLAGDSSVMVDVSRRWLFFDGARIVASLSPDAPLIQATRGQSGEVDSLGHVLVVVDASYTRGGVTVIGGRDSAIVVLVSRATAKPDTVARLRESARRVESFTDGNGVQITRFIRLPFAAREQAVLFLDGWLAIARLEPYRVEWRTPLGQTIKGAPLPITLARVEERDKAAIRDSVPSRPGRPPAVDLTKWPSRVPPFQTSPLLAAPDGRLLIRRTVTASHRDTRYDVVDRRGALVGEITLGRNEHIIGFGARSAYVVWKDDDGIERLRRHPWQNSRGSR